MSDIRHCSGCSCDLPLDSFYSRGKEGRCIQCCRKRAKQWREVHREAARAANRAWVAAHPEEVKSYREEYKPRKFELRLRHRYGITVEQYEDLPARYNGECWICGSTDKLGVDRDHVTGIVRGLLCWPCNASLGKLNENPARLRQLADYLEGKSR